MRFTVVVWWSRACVVCVCVWGVGGLKLKKKKKEQHNEIYYNNSKEREEKEDQRIIQTVCKKTLPCNPVIAFYLFFDEVIYLFNFERSMKQTQINLELKRNQCCNDVISLNQRSESSNRSSLFSISVFLSFLQLRT